MATRKRTTPSDSAPITREEQAALMRELVRDVTRARRLDEAEHALRVLAEDGHQDAFDLILAIRAARLNALMREIAHGAKAALKTRKARDAGRRRSLNAQSDRGTPRAGRVHDRPVSRREPRDAGALRRAEAVASAEARAA